VTAWREALDAHLLTRGIRNHTKSEGYKFEPSEFPDTSGRLHRLLGGSGDAGCQKKYDEREKLSYPSSALYQGFVGSVILRIDLDAEGKASNPEILAAVPEKYFGDAVLKSVPSMRYVQGEVWGPSCSLAETGRIIAFKFQIGRR
jgi:TonB family protein